ncbi:hypothetical protein AT2G29920 [Arabidopsis thaliana]|uniref:Uncharacterized protein n=1 Tax=Arabidopsis thaliana TaxID=3702 RepID=F4ILP4_ARATH|nr:uncharacterized protein AT2G29920 [Arabidopsis thaliana]AEC08321.2 hypothetical protein AT2G29920 [Arabidopsis thaliana]|eukprot:NP_001318315.1 hypothetical protein AT2G29920 [Arabidopsis thaliana]
MAKPKNKNKSHYIVCDNSSFHWFLLVRKLNQQIGLYIVTGEITWQQLDYLRTTSDADICLKSYMVCTFCVHSDPDSDLDFELLLLHQDHDLELLLTDSDLDLELLLLHQDHDLELLLTDSDFDLELLPLHQDHDLELLLPDSEFDFELLPLHQSYDFELLLPDSEFDLDLLCLVIFLVINF